ncbi:hypothetical protein ATANTOWER_018419 [Ataeniobius toweri]|uniref:Uncharacterized protein n=1 Tax=Ataeniobius toweri TaxID=208326 RepID=A0ABU7BI07_9TELE|nr:hypothetical protein [Ataeniobius toweri]
MQLCIRLSHYSFSYASKYSTTHPCSCFSNYLSVKLSIPLFVHPDIKMSVHLTPHSFVFPTVPLYISLFAIYPTPSQFFQLSICSSVQLTICLSIPPTIFCYLLFPD